MKSGIIIFPGSNCDKDLAFALNSIAGNMTQLIWHKDSSLPRGLDIIFIPGGFSFGDYLRCGAIAAHSPIMKSVVSFANSGGYILGICNGFQILTETSLLPGSLMRNINLKFICCEQEVISNTNDNIFTKNFVKGKAFKIPVAHHDGNYVCNDTVLDSLMAEDRIALQYAENKNGSKSSIAGVLSKNKRVLGMMPHPERAMDKTSGLYAGKKLFYSIIEHIN